MNRQGANERHDRTRVQRVVAVIFQVNGQADLHGYPVVVWAQEGAGTQAAVPCWPSFLKVEGQADQQTPIHEQAGSGTGGSSNRRSNMQHDRRAEHSGRPSASIASSGTG